jgi:hypothetical protein
MYIYRESVVLVDVSNFHFLPPKQAFFTSEPSPVPKRSWADKKTRIEFFQNTYKALGLQKMEDWYTVEPKRVRAMGGSLWQHAFPA